MNLQQWYVRYTFILAAIVLTVYVMIVAKQILVPLLFAIFLSVLLSPVCNRLERIRVPRFLAALIAILAAVGILSVLLFFLYNQLSAFTQDIDLIQQRIEELIEDMEGFLATWFAMDQFIEFDTIEDAVVDFIRENTAALTRGLAGAATLITGLFLVPIYMFLLLIFRDFLQEFLLQAFGGKSDERLHKVKTIIGRVKGVVQYYISGILIVIAILAVINSTMLWIVGVNHAIFFGTFAAMLNVIPFLGPIFGSILPALYALLTMDSLIYPVIILAAFYVIQLFESNLFTPVIVGGKVSLNALVSLLLLFIGAQIWGLAGMILFIPLGAMLKVVFDEIESLKPYGFLMGRVPAVMQSRRGPLAKRIQKISEKARIEAEKEMARRDRKLIDRELKEMEYKEEEPDEEDESTSDKNSSRNSGGS